MNKYIATVRIKGNSIRTVVFAENATHARLLLQYEFGMNSVLSNPALGEASQPATPEQQKIATLKAAKDRAADALSAERKRQQTARAQKALAAARQPTPPRSTSSNGTMGVV